MGRWDAAFWRAVLCYIMASIACLLYILWPNFEGHTHVPFSAFPDFLVWAPISPYLAFREFKNSASEAITALTVFGFVFVACYGALKRFAHRK